MNSLVILLLLVLLVNAFAISFNDKVTNNINPMLMELQEHQQTALKMHEKDRFIFTGSAFLFGLGASMFMGGSTAVANNIAANKHRAANKEIAKYQAKCEKEIDQIAMRLTKFYDDMKYEMTEASKIAKQALVKDQTYKSRHLSILLVQIIGSSEPEYVAKLAKGINLSGKEDNNVAANVAMSIVQSVGEQLLKDAGLSFVPGVGTVWSAGKLGNAIHSISEAKDRTERMKNGYKQLCHRTKERVKFDTCKNTHEVYEQLRIIHYTLKNLDERRSRILGPNFHSQLLTYVTKAVEIAKSAYKEVTCSSLRKRSKAKCLNTASDNSKVCCPVTDMWWGSIHKQHISSKDDKPSNMGKGKYKRVKVSDDRYINIFSKDCTVESRFKKPYYSGLETITVKGKKKPSELFSNGAFGRCPYEPIIRTVEKYKQYRKIKNEDLPAGLDDISDAVGWTESRSVLWDVEHQGIKHSHNMGTDDITYLIGTRFPGPPIVSIDNDDSNKAQFYEGNMHQVVDLDGDRPMKIYVGVQEYLTKAAKAHEIKMSHDEKAKMYTLSTRIADDVRKKLKKGKKVSKVKKHSTKTDKKIEKVLHPQQKKKL